MAKQQVLVLGLGRFGRALALELERLGHEVLAIDRDEKTVEEMGGLITQAVCADTTVPQVLKDVGAADFDTVIVAVGIEHPSILSTALVKRLGAKEVLARASNSLHADILRMVGADRVIDPEEESGVRLAHSVGGGNVLDYYRLTPDFGIEKVSARPFSGKTLGELNFRGRFSVTPVFLLRLGKVVVNPDDAERLDVADELLLAGAELDLQKLRNRAF